METMLNTRTLRGVERRPIKIQIYIVKQDQVFIRSELDVDRDLPRASRRKIGLQVRKQGRESNVGVTRRRARLSAAITGVDHNGVEMVSVKERYDGVFQWLRQPGVLCLRFEDIINQRDAALCAMLDAVEATGYEIPTPRPQCLAILNDAIQPKKSRTFRSGKTGGWREHFTVDRINGFMGHELKFEGQKLVSNYLRIGYDPEGSWRIYKLRPDFHPADKAPAIRFAKPSLSVALYFDGKRRSDRPMLTAGPYEADP